MKITELYIDAAVLDFPVTRHIMRRLNLNSHVVDAPDDTCFARLQPWILRWTREKNFSLTQNRGRFIRQCPGTEYYTCCNYMISGNLLHNGLLYRILQSYFHPPVLQFLSIMTT
ncbi:MAG: hypothetical protein R2860_12640 [Desulfobacterales bacterium]